MGNTIIKDQETKKNKKNEKIFNLIHEYFNGAAVSVKETEKKDNTKKPVTYDDVKTILDPKVYNEITDTIVNVTTMVRDGGYEQEALYGKTKQINDAAKEWLENNRKKNLPAVVVEVVEKDEVPFKEDKKKKNDKIVEGKFTEFVETKDKKEEKKTEDKKEDDKKKKPQEAFRFTSLEEAQREAEKINEEEKQKLKKVNNLPPIETVAIESKGNVSYDIENEKVKNFLESIFKKILTDRQYVIKQHASGLFVIYVDNGTGLEDINNAFFIDNNSVVRSGPRMIMDIVLNGMRCREYVSILDHIDDGLVYSWITNPSLRQSGIGDIGTVNKLISERIVPHEVISVIDLSSVSKEVAANKEFMTNLYNLYMCPHMQEIPYVRFRVDKYTSPTKFRLVSDNKVRTPLLDWGLQAKRIAAKPLTIAFDSPTSIKVMYDGCKKTFSL